MLGEVHPLDGDAEAALYKLGGPWCAVILGDEPRVLTDAFGHLSVLYSADAETVATAPALIPGAEPEEDVRTLFGIPDRDNWYPFGLTGYRNVRRLLPNHGLSLRTWQALRHWPRPSDLAAGPMSVEDAAACVVERTRAAVDAIASRHALVLPLTAGHDSRLILACARRHARDVWLVTTDGHPVTGAIDGSVARRLARRHGLAHEVQQITPASEAEMAAWSLQVGGAAGGAARRNVATTNAWARRGVQLAGMGGEVLRAFYHGRASARALERGLDVGGLLDVIRLPGSPAVEEAGSEWLAGLPDLSHEHLLEVLYIEQRLGCWAGPMRHGGRGVRFWPMAHRDVAALAFRLPLDAKQASAVHREAIRQAWPELLREPFNEPVGWAAARLGVRSALGRLRSVLGPRGR